jgi:hypothetical protein
MSSPALEQAKAAFSQLNGEDRLSLLAEVGIGPYPWYRLVDGDGVEQGEILENCPVYSPPAELAMATVSQVTFRWSQRDLIVLSQSCDLVKGREKVEECLLCPIWKRSELPPKHHLGSNNGMEDARRGNLPAFHVLAASTVPGFEREARIVEFARISVLPLGFLRRFAEKTGPRLRLLPPYREHLSQAFARFFMRVGLPVDIPSFK